MSYLHVQALESIDNEFSAAASALAYVARVWHELGDQPEVHGVHLPHVRQALDNLETTYIIRRFSQYEAILHDHLSTSYPRLRVPRTAEALINRVALRERLPASIRDAAQAVRELRNALVHRRMTPVSSRSLREVMAALNRFLAQLP